MKVLLRMFSRRWLLATILVVGGVALCVRLGIWQIDRLEQRRTFNNRVLAQIDQPGLLLAGDALKADLYNMEYRKVDAMGEYDFSQQVAIRNQVWNNQWGVHLVTPLVIAGSGGKVAVLVDRGWIPAESYQSGDWSGYNEAGTITVHGVLRRPMDRAEMGSRTDPTPVPGAAPLKSWNFVNIKAIQQQSSYALLPVYIQQAPDPAWISLPYRSQPEIEITEGPHMGYAIQWFSFATLLGVGYPFFIRRSERR